MTNSPTTDRRDVVHQTNPVGNHETIEAANTNLAQPPARSGQAQADVAPAEPDKANPGRMDQKRAAGRGTVHVQSPRSIGQ